MRPRNSVRIRHLQRAIRLWMEEGTMKNILTAFGVLGILAAAMLLAAPEPFEVSCNPQTIVASNSANATQIGGVNAKRELAWMVAAPASNAIGFYVKFYDSNVAPTVNATTPTAIF